MSYSYQTTRDDDDEGTFVFAHHNEKMVGHLHVPDEEIGHKHWRIGDIYVDEKHRRHGVGTSMINHMTKHIGSKPSGASSVFTPEGKALYSSLKEWAKTKFSNYSMLDVSKADKGTETTLVGNVQGGGMMDIQAVMDKDGKLVTPFGRRSVQDIQKANGEMHLTSPRKPRPPGAKVKSSGHRIHTIHEVFVDHDIGADGDGELEHDDIGKASRLPKTHQMGEYSLHHSDNKTHISHKGTVVGVIEHQKLNDHTLQVKHILIHQNHRGAGLMARSYKALVDSGKDIVSDSTLSRGAHKSWERLKKDVGYSVGGWDNNSDKTVPINKVMVSHKDSMKAHFTSYHLSKDKS